VFTVSGLWHGAQWTFVIWGAMNGVFIIISRLTQTVRDRIKGKIFSGIAIIPAVVYFTLCAAFITFAVLGGMFGAASATARIAAAAGGLALCGLGILRMQRDMFDRFLNSVRKIWMIFVTFHLFMFGGVFFRSQNLADAWYIITQFPGLNFSEIKLFFKTDEILLMVGLIIFLIIIHLIQERRGSIRQQLRTKPLVIRWVIYYLFVISLFLGMYKTSQFFYFQF